MRRMLLVLTVSAMMLAALLTGPVSAQDFDYDDDFYDDDDDDAPRAAQCDWYGPYHQRPWDPWWEYWCWWPGWGWEYVFWSY